MLVDRLVLGVHSCRVGRNSDANLACSCCVFSVVARRYEASTTKFSRSLPSEVSIAISASILLVMAGYNTTSPLYLLPFSLLLLLGVNPNRRSWRFAKECGGFLLTSTVLRHNLNVSAAWSSLTALCALTEDCSTFLRVSERCSVC